MRRLAAIFCAMALAFAGGAFARQARPAAKTNWANVVTITPQGGYRQGNPNAVVKLIEYGSRTCPTCARFAAEGVPPLRTDYVAAGTVSYEYRDYLIHGAPDLALALLNQCVPTARFFPVLDAMYANQPLFESRLHAFMDSDAAQAEAWQQLPPAQAAARFADKLGMIAFMKTQGVSEVRARQCLADPALLKRIATTNADGVKIYGVDGTPTFIVNSRRMSAYSWDRLLPELWANGA